MRVRGGRDPAGKGAGCVCVRKTRATVGTCTREAFVCVCSCVHARMCVCVRACVARVGKGQNMSAHWERGSFTRRDHFTLPPEAFFPPKAFSCSWVNTCRECNRERKTRIILTYNSLQKYCRTKDKKRRKEEGGRGGREREKFLFFSFFSSFILLTD